MTIKSSGPISASDISVQLGNSPNAQMVLGSSNVRSLLGKTVGAISLSNAYGKGPAYSYNITISANTLDYNLQTALTALGWNGTSSVSVNLTINAGIYVGSSSTTTAALIVPSLPTGSLVTITNNGYIVGKGGAGGKGGGISQGPGFVGNSGGPALKIGYATTIINNGIIGGGGGGGAGGNATYNSTAGGGGGGGGRGYNVGSAGVRGSGQSTNGVPGQPGTLLLGGDGGGGGGGGAAGTGVATGTGGTGGNGGTYSGGGGGAGGGLGGTGGVGGTTSWYTAVPAGGAPGVATIGNNYITWSTPGTVYGTKT